MFKKIPKDDVCDDRLVSAAYILLSELHDRGLVMVGKAGEEGLIHQAQSVSINGISIQINAVEDDDPDNYKLMRRERREFENCMGEPVFVPTHVNRT